MCVLLLRVLLRATRGEWLCGASDCRLPDVAPTGCAVLHVATSAGHACLPRRAQLWHFAQDGERAAEPAPSAGVYVPACACVRLLVALAPAVCQASSAPGRRGGTEWRCIVPPLRLLLLIWSCSSPEHQIIFRAAHVYTQHTGCQCLLPSCLSRSSRGKDCGFATQT
jgi:hypothetical protein